MMPPRTVRAKPSGRAGRQGFVLLSLLFFVAAIAIQVAISLPQAAMQAQRVREERLIYRGKQYKRAVQLYFRKHQKYPEKIDDLEETNGQRFLRRRYKDPLTGEDEWRLIHMGADGRMTDSLIYDTEEEEGQEGSSLYRGTRSSVPMGSSVGFQGYSAGLTTPDGRFRGAERARAVRQSAAPTIPGQSAPGAYGGTGQPGYEGELDPNNPNNPNPSPYGIAPGQPGQPGQAGQPGAGGQPVAGQYPGYSRVLPGQVPPTAGQRAGNRQRLPGPFGAQLGTGYPRGATNRPLSNRTGFGGQGFGSAGGQPAPGRRTGPPQGFGSQGMNQQAANVIGRLLTQPRPGGLQGLRGRGGSTSGQTGFSKGIAGVASRVEDRGVMVYEGRENYNEWEFVYDYRQDQGIGAAGAGVPGTMAGQRPAGGQPGLTSGGFMTARPGAVGGARTGAGAFGSSSPSGSRRTGSPYGAGGASSPYGQRRPGFTPNLPGTSNFPYSRRTNRRRPGQPPRPGVNQPGSPYPAPPAIPGITAPPQNNSGAAPASPDARSRR